MRSPLARARQPVGTVPPGSVRPALRVVNVRMGRRAHPSGSLRASETPSLFVVSLPRSLSSLLYGVACRSLGLAEPAWTTAGEILNRDRVPRRLQRFAPEEERFTLLDAEPATFERMTAFLEQAAQPHGYAYKDVVQPFVLASWAGLAEFRVLKIRRDVAEVAYAMAKRRWAYPSHAASLFDEHPWSIIEGLVQAEAVIDSLPGATLDYEYAVLGHEPLQHALSALYPDDPIAPIRYIDRGFVRTRKRLEAERQSSLLFRQIQQAVGIVRERLRLDDPRHAVARALP